MPARALPDDYKPKFLEDHVETLAKQPVAFCRGFLAYVDDDHYCPYEQDTAEADAFVAGVQCARRNVVEVTLEKTISRSASPSSL